MSRVPFVSGVPGTPLSVTRAGSDVLRRRQAGALIRYLGLEGPFQNPPGIYVGVGTDHLTGRRLDALHPIEGMLRVLHQLFRWTGVPVVSRAGRKDTKHKKQGTAAAHEKRMSRFTASVNVPLIQLT